MILFLNVFITNKALTFYDRGRLGTAPDRLAVFKYSLASFSVISWSAVFIHCELDEPYAGRREELEKWVHTLFPQAHLFFERATKQAHWKRILQPVFDVPGDDLVWYFCNDDHIFIDYDLSMLEAIANKAKQLASRHKYVSAYVSHWPELLTFLNPNISNFYAEGSPPQASQILEATDQYFVNRWYNFDSVQIVNKNVLLHWWFEHEYGDTFLPRSDYPPYVKSPPDIYCVVPMRELVRHFDGYSHARIDINVCPPLSIPPGFFEKHMRLSFGAPQRVEGKLHINPLIRNYATVDRDGVDSRMTLDDLPLFWRNRIVEIQQEADPKSIEIVRARNESVLRMVTQNCRMPLTEIVKRFTASLRGGVEALPLLEVQELKSFPRIEYPCLVSRPCAVANPRFSVLIVEAPDGQPAVTSIASLRAQSVPRNLFEIVRVSVTQAHQAFPAAAEADVVIHSKQFHAWSQGSFSIHRGFNEAASLAHGKVLVLCEAGIEFDSQFIFNLEKLYFGAGPEAVAQVVLHAERPTGGMPKFSFAELANGVISLRSEDFASQCGLDESVQFLGLGADRSEFVGRIMQAGVPVVCSTECIFRGRRVRSAFPAPAFAVPPPVIGNEFALTGASMRPPTLGSVNLFDLAFEQTATKVNLALLSGNFPLAQRAVKSCVELLPDANRDFEKILSLVAKSSYAEACAEIEAIRMRYAFSIEIINLHAILSFLGQNFPQTEKLLDESLTRDIANPTALFLLAAAQREAGETEKADALQRQITQNYPLLGSLLS